MSILWKDDPAYLLNAANFHKMMPDVFCFGDHYLESAGDASIKILAHTKFVINNSGTFKIYNVGATDITLTAANLDVGGVFTLGSNYYVYLCDNGTDNESYIISLNSTYPSGYNANNSRKIGGFHYGRRRNSITVTDVTSGVIVSNLIWDLKFRPKCSPEGMVCLGVGVWVDTYKVSVNAAITFSAGNGSPLTGGSGKSAYGATPLTGTEGLSGYNFIELARMSGKRLLTMAEWLQAAHGSPQGNDADNVNAWTMTTNPGRTNTGSVVNTISLLNVVDCIGNVWEWLDEFIIREAGTLAWNWYNVMPAMNVGKLYMHSNQALVQILAGGVWSSGVNAGSRCVSLGYFPWDVNAGIGSRFACDAL